MYFTVLALFVAWYVRHLDFSVLAGTRPSVFWLSIASSIAIGSRFWGIFIWREMLRGLDAQVGGRWGLLAYVYAKAWLGRYIPGKLGSILGKIYFGADIGISRERLAVAALIDALQQLAIMLLLAASILALDARLDIFPLSQRLLLFIIAITMLVAMHPRIFNALIGATRSLRPNTFPVDKATVRSGTLLYGCMLQTGGFVLAGLSCVAFTKALVPAIGITDVLFVLGAFNLAAAIGILAIFAPSGIGVREGVQLLLLPLIMSAELAFVVTVAARIWSTAMDMVFFMITAAYKPTSTNHNGISPNGTQ